jgi:chaperonin GroES
LPLSFVHFVSFCSELFCYESFASVRLNRAPRREKIKSANRRAFSCVSCPAKRDESANVDRWSAPREFSFVKVVPLGDNVVVRRIDAPHTTLAGIVLPKAVKDSAQQGRVLSVGDGRRLADGSRLPNQVREGDRVLFAHYAGIEVAVSGEELLIMSEDEILAIVP